jgi:hypothetical protein
MASDLELQPASQEDRFVAVYTTVKILLFNMVLDTLRQAQVPVQAHEETGTGLKLAMPVVPTQGPGVFWTLSVPEKALGDAQRVLSELPFPIGTNPAPGISFLIPKPRKPEQTPPPGSGFWPSGFWRSRPYSSLSAPSGRFAARIATKLLP